MENLYDKLLPKFKKILKHNQKKYPSAVRRIIATLKYKDYYGDLTIEELKTLCTFADVDWSRVDWKFGEDLFGKISNLTDEEIKEITTIKK